MKNAPEKCPCCGRVLPQGNVIDILHFRDFTKVTTYTKTGKILHFETRKVIYPKRRSLFRDIWREIKEGLKDVFH